MANNTNTVKTDRQAINAEKQLKAMNNATEIVDALRTLSKKRDEWETTVFKKANEGLYALLADCLKVYLEKFVTAEDAGRKELRKQLITELSNNRIKVQKNTNILTMLTRMVFQSDRKRAHGYGYVLAAAVSHGWTPEELPQQIANEGGIEEIKRKMVKSAEAIERTEKLNQAKSSIKEDIEGAAVTPIASVELEGLEGNYAILLARPGSDGVANIVGALSNVSEALFKTLIAQMAKAKIKGDEESAILDNEVNMFAVAASNDDNAKKAA